MASHAPVNRRFGNTSHKDLLVALRAQRTLVEAALETSQNTTKSLLLLDARAFIDPSGRLITLLKRHLKDQETLISMLADVYDIFLERLVKD